MLSITQNLFKRHLAFHISPSAEEKSVSQVLVPSPPFSQSPMASWHECDLDSQIWLIMECQRQKVIKGHLALLPCAVGEAPDTYRSQKLMSPQDHTGSRWQSWDYRPHSLSPETCAPSLATSPTEREAHGIWGQDRPVMRAHDCGVLRAQAHFPSCPVIVNNNRHVASYVYHEVGIKHPCLANQSPNNK